MTFVYGLVSPSPVCSVSGLPLAFCFVFKQPPFLKSDRFSQNMTILVIIWFVFCIFDNTTYVHSVPSHWYVQTCPTKHMLTHLSNIFDHTTYTKQKRARYTTPFSFSFSSCTTTQNWSTGCKTDCRFMLQRVGQIISATTKTSEYFYGRPDGYKKKCRLML